MVALVATAVTMTMMTVVMVMIVMMIIMTVVAVVCATDVVFPAYVATFVDNAMDGGWGMWRKWPEHRQGCHVRVGMLISRNDRSEFLELL